MPRRPDFFIVGAPKCGTTALTDYLAQHPQVGMCERKETQYFAFDLYPAFGRATDRPWISQDEYLSLFSEAQDKVRIGEASVWYLYSAAAPREISEFSPEAKIIVMVRNPLEAVPSLHSQFVFVGIEPVEDLEEALALDGERERLGTPPFFPPRSYRSAARYSEQLERYLSVFGRDRVQVIVYDDFRRDTLEVYRRTCEFLDIDRDFVPRLEIVNPNKRVRSRGLRNLVRYPPPPLRRAFHRISSKRFRRQAGSLLTRLNTRFEPRPPVPPAVAESLRPLVADEVTALEALVDLDLRSWLDVPVADLSKRPT